MDCEYFTVDKGHQAKNCEVLLSHGDMKIIIIISGSGTITGGEVDAVEFKTGDCLLIPAAYEGAICFTENTEYLTVKL